MKIDGKIPDLPGIDIEASPLRDKMGLYRRLLLMFRKDQRDFEQNFRSAQKDDDQETVIRMVHSIKGNAGNLGAMDLYEASHLLEKACIEKSDNIEELLSNMIAELEKVIVGLEIL